MEQQHERALALLDDVDAHAVGGDDLMTGSLHGAAVWFIEESLAGAVYAVYNDPW